MENDNKGKKIVIITLIVLLLIAIILILLYLFTDLFKTKKQIFLEYLSQNSSILTFFQDETLTAYQEKKKSTPYNNRGNLSLNVEDNSSMWLDQKEREELNNFFISFDGQADNPNSKREENVKLQYTDEESFPIQYKQTGNYFGLKSDQVVDKYVSIENNQLKELASLLGIEDITAIPDRIDIDKSIFLTKEEVKKISQTYTSLIYENISDENIVETQTELGKSYELQLTKRQAINLAIIICEQLKTDGILIEKLSAYTTEEEYTNQIDNIINSLNNQSISDQIWLRIIVTTNTQSQLEQTDIIINGIGYSIQLNNDEVLIWSGENQEVKLTLQKEKSNNQMNYHIDYVQNTSQTNNVEISLDYSFSGIQALETVSELGQLTINLAGEVGTEEQTNEQNSETIQNFYNVIEQLMSQGQTITFDIASQVVEQNFSGQLSIEQTSDQEYTVKEAQTGKTYTLSIDGTMEEIQSQNESDNLNNVVIEYTYENENQFTPNVAIEDLTQDNSKVINSMEQEELTNLISAIIERIKTVNIEQMQRIGYSYNPLIFFTLQDTEDIDSIEQPQENAQQPQQNNTQRNEEQTNELQQQNNEQNQTNQINEQIMQLNQRMMVYQGESIAGDSLLSLLELVKQYYTILPNSALRLVINETEIPQSSIDQIIAQIKSTQQFQIILQTDENTGLVTQITVNQKTN